MSRDVLSFNEVSVAFARPGAPATRALDTVSVALRKGEVLGIVGESGSGKTTLAKAAVGLVTPSSGAISLDGQPLSFAGRAGKHLRRRLQYEIGRASCRERV